MQLAILLLPLAAISTALPHKASNDNKNMTSIAEIEGLSNSTLEERGLACWAPNIWCGVRCIRPECHCCTDTAPWIANWKVCGPGEACSPAYLPNRLNFNQHMGCCRRAKSGEVICPDDPRFEQAVEEFKLDAAHKDRENYWKTHKEAGGDMPPSIELPLGEAACYIGYVS